ncbi:hypothetical protein NC652_011662 [Populus alba x Populus x berolinensis]|nr:hypothetical protein NC652_011662 [Populus alba x Populus x berolinensis]
MGTCRSWLHLWSGSGDDTHNIEINMHLLNFFWLTKHMVVVSRFRHSITLKSQHALTAAVDSEMQTKVLFHA